MLLTIYSIAITVAWMATSIYILIYSQKIPFLKDVAVPGSERPPTVAIIVAVKDEEAEVEGALLSLCNLDYDNDKIIVINDRSTDRTGLIVGKMAELYPQVSVVTIHELPAGWLGKNHALYQGYIHSTSEWILFTDADVHFSSLALNKAIHYATSNSLDHLTVLPEITSPSVLFKAVMNTFSIMLEVKLRPWSVTDPSSDASIGVGAFNLVRRYAYEKAGTHIAISLRPDDDLKLGERIKRAGLKQGVLYGENEIWLQWYSSLSEFIHGLMKNTFSVSNYRLSTVIGMAIAVLFVFVLPIPILILSGYWFRIMAAAILLCMVVLMQFKTGIHGHWWHALLIPFSGVVMIYIIVASAIQTLRQGGIYWRGSFYSLEELRKQR